MRTFAQWVESEEAPALSEPQHKKGEANMALDAIVERRMRQMIMDLEGSGKGTQEEILASVVKYADKKGAKTDKPEAPEQPRQQTPDMGGPQADMGGPPDAGLMQQTPQQGMPAPRA